MDATILGFPKIVDTCLGIPIIRIMKRVNYSGVPLFREITKSQARKDTVLVLGFGHSLWDD